MVTRLNHSTATDGLPELLTVEEAAQLLRIGRTKAYAMAREWRDSGGRSGLPVIDLGNVLRVPLHALKQMIGAQLRWSPEPPAAADRVGGGPSGPGPQDEHARAPTPRRGVTRSSRTSRHKHADQPALFEPPPTSASS